MAGNENQSGGTAAKCYRSPIAGLSVVVGEPADGQVAPQTVRFTPYEYTSEVGEKLLFGYLKTKNARAIEVLDKDFNATEISEDEYKKYTDTKNSKIRRAAL
jgi:hypothetical protein